MGPPDLLLICISSFTAVFVLLIVLSLVMRGLIAVFPAKVTTSDAPMLAAVAAAVAHAFPGARISSIEEKR